MVCFVHAARDRNVSIVNFDPTFRYIAYAPARIRVSTRAHATAFQAEVGKRLPWSHNIDDDILIRKVIIATEYWHPKETSPFPTMIT